jgi:hypothetical protein
VSTITLTRDQVRAEPAGRRLDAWVARHVMRDIRGRDGVWRRRDNHRVTIQPGPWDYSRHPHDAWAVVERLVRLGWNVYLTALAKGEHEAMVSTCVEDHEHGIGDTMPLAVCRAALLARIREGT